MGANNQLAILGGQPVRSHMLSYGRQCVDQADIDAVVETLKSDFLTTGPKVSEFERLLAEQGGVPWAVAVNSGTAALHVAYHACGLGAGDEILVPAITFSATANAARYLGATPVFVDVNAKNILLDLEDAKKKLTKKTKALVTVDYAGQPCDYDELAAFCKTHNLLLIADAAHSWGASYQNKPVGSLADVTALSFHPVKTITTGEGGAVLMRSETFAKKALMFRSHGISRDFKSREAALDWLYDIASPGFNYRLPDINAALGISQLHKTKTFVQKRQELARQYFEIMPQFPGLETLTFASDRTCAFHLFPVLLKLDMFKVGRAEIFKALRAEGIGVNVHYIPVHQLTAYKSAQAQCPVADEIYERQLSLPIHAGMDEQDFHDVSLALKKVCEYYLR